MTAIKIYAVFVLTYAGFYAGKVPWLRVDRTGIALLGLIALLASRALTLDELSARVDLPTLLLLFALMIIGAQMVNSGFVDTVFARICGTDRTPLTILALTVVLAGGLAAFLANDILVYVAAPLLMDRVRARGLDARPYLIALIAAANAGSAATIIGAPQTIIIGELGNLQLPTYLLACAVPSILALGIVFLTIAVTWRGRFELSAGIVSMEPPSLMARPHDRFQTNKGFVALAFLLALFCSDLPKDVFALSIAAFLLLNRKLPSRQLIAGVDWPLLLLTACLFAVTGALGSTTGPGRLIDLLQLHGLLPDNLMLLVPLILVISCTIGILPGVIVLLQVWQDAPSGVLYGLALISSLAGNFLVIANLSNLIIVERAAERGVVLRRGEFARIGIPVTILSIGIASAWLYLTGFMPLAPVHHG